MKLKFALTAIATTAVLAFATAAVATPHEEGRDFDFSGQLSLGDCSGSIIRFTADENANAVALTNGHCVGMLDVEADAVWINRPYRKSLRAYKTLQETVPVQSTRILYGIMQPHDVVVMELNQTYAQLAAQGVRAREVAAEPAKVGDRIVLATGLFRRATVCKIESIVHQIKEDIWTNTDAYKYRECFAGHGTSGSPLISESTGRVVGMNYTGNDEGQRCTFNNPCEVDEAGVIRVDPGANYGDPLHKLLSCLNDRREFDTNVAGCLLPHAR